jgi:hypothetical protein
MADHEIVIRVVVEQPSAAPSTPADEFQEVGKRTPSQLMRLALMRRYNRQKPSIAFESYYERIMQTMIEAIDKS